MPCDCLEIRVQSVRAALALASASFFDHPENNLILIGVTGTKGKSTVCEMIAHILNSAGKSCSVISTLGIKIGDDDSIAYKQLEKYKFKIVKSSNDTIVAKKHRLRINVSIGDNYEIKEISVTVDTTNVLRVQY